MATTHQPWTGVLQLCIVHSSQQPCCSYKQLHRRLPVESETCVQAMRVLCETNAQPYVTFLSQQQLVAACPAFAEGVVLCSAVQSGGPW